MPCSSGCQFVSVWETQDALLHPSLPLLVWLMAAVPKGYAMGRMLALACLTIIHELASVRVRDHHSPGEPYFPFHGHDRMRQG